MEIKVAGTQPLKQASAERFTGTVWQDSLRSPEGPDTTLSLHVTFEPGARTAWHTHPLGQMLYITAGVGLVCSRGEKPKIVRGGDTVWIPAGEEHWHGAGPTTLMSHMAIQEVSEGSAADWLELVADADYPSSLEEI